MEKKIEPFKIRVNSEQAKVVRERMRACGVIDKVSNDYVFERNIYSCISYSNTNNTIIDYFDIRGISFPEISYEDFLNMFPEAREGRKIIGWNIKPEFEKLREVIANTLLTSPEQNSDGAFIRHNHLSFERAEKLKVLNLWFDPVYEEEKPEKKAFIIGSRTWIGQRGSGQALSGGDATTIEEMETVILEEEERIKKKKGEIETLKEIIKFVQK